MINFSTFNIDTNGRTSGRMKTHCPQCRDRRKDKRDKSLSVNLDLGLAYCHYCNWKCNARTVPQKPAVVLPKTAVLANHWVRWFVEKRGIPASVLIAAGITSAEEYMPQTRRKESCICFNYYEGGRLVNTKFRDAEKNFKLTAGAELIPYNIDGILGTEECIITEGEIDALSFMAVGRTDVVSIPAGANCNLGWMDRFVASHFDDKRAIYICVDTDRKGREVQRELVRRLGAERCRIVDLLPAKDANEVLLEAHGREALLCALEHAPEAPLEGVFTATDVADEMRAIFDNGLGSGAATGWENLDRICTFELGRLLVLTGIPGSGKSEFVDELVVRLNLRHHWRTAFFSPENMPLAYHLQKLAEKVGGSPFRRGITSEVQYVRTVEYLSDNFISILPKDNFTAENVLSKALELVRRRGIRIFVLDPVNCIDHCIPSGQSETQYMNAFLDRLANFARRHRLLIIVVAHPRKMHREAGTQKLPVPDMYDVNGSAAFYNKCDYGMVVERNREARVTRLHVKKVKFKHLGDDGVATFVYNRINGRFTVCDEKPGIARGAVDLLPQPFDSNSWLEEELQMPGIF